MDLVLTENEVSAVSVTWANWRLRFHKTNRGIFWFDFVSCFGYSHVFYSHVVVVNFDFSVNNFRSFVFIENFENIQCSQYELDDVHNDLPLHWDRRRCVVIKQSFNELWKVNRGRWWLNNTTIRELFGLFTVLPTDRVERVAVGGEYNWIYTYKVKLSPQT